MKLPRASVDNFDKYEKLNELVGYSVKNQKLHSGDDLSIVWDNYFKRSIFFGTFTFT